MWWALPQLKGCPGNQLSIDRGMNILYYSHVRMPVIADVNKDLHGSQSKKKNLKDAHCRYIELCH